MTIGNRIAELRKAKGFTQEYVADQLGVSRQAVSKWEQDQTSPDTKNLIALAELLDTDIGFLAMGTASRDQIDMEVRKLKATVDAKTSGGYMLLYIGIAFTLLTILFGLLSLLLGLILIVIGVVYLINASHLQDAIPKKPPKRPTQAVLKPWICYSCGEENEGRVQYCINCQTNKAWSEMKQQEKAENK